MALNPDEAEGLLSELCLYARAATGSGALANRVVEAALLHLAKAPPRISDPPARLHLFQAVQDQLGALPAPGQGAEGMADLVALLAGEAPARPRQPGRAGNFADAWLSRRLGRLSPLRREVLLLYHLIGFSTAEIACIIRRDAPSVEAMLRASWKQLAPPPQADILIIEDEMLIALDLSMLMRDLGHRVRGIAADRAEAEALLQQGVPDLILSDLRLGLQRDEGQRIVAALGDEIAVPVVYVTACPEDAPGTADDGRPVYVVPKPFCSLSLSLAVCDALAAAGERDGSLN
ncbi:sigma factor-like helix-turn-helix DNA-binding protein [Roseomonas sp. E05]|uniref:sigma factor-like helix-turn-helix DNA-binding protein n=1 Tax=Roseomonas sp. E05 TaxID=3046310 RepID=UPI0024BA8B37|nr:sigma factor-like helix-turn-helix DNA-binding protein [Roseomonas sp. E05]MDJ0387176.1 sigma factor-like helix-turn-helix DNA-binding protein [Roseomonas sp. E05]